MSEPPVEAPPPEDEHAADAVAVEEAPLCWRCGSPHDRFQEYCLECGARLVPLAGARGGWRRDTWTRDSPVWFWAVILGLLIVALLGATIVLAATRDDEPPREQPGAAPAQSVSTLGSIPTLPPVTEATTSGLPDTVLIPPGTATTSPVPTLPPPPTPPAGSPPPPAPSPSPSPSPTPTPPPAPGGIRSWPAGQTGYTIILTSIPQGQGRPAAEQRAREAVAKGVQDVGVLNSSDYGSLKTGYYVVFAGVHDTETQAVAQLRPVRQAGYPVAYVREINPG